MSHTFRFLMLSAMYENGGNTTHRFLDGHPQMLVYPFESQIGTRWVSDALASTFPVKYRWPVFPLHGDPASDFSSIIDEELKVRSRTPHVSKFRHVEVDLDDEERKRVFVAIAGRGERTRARNVEAFFRSTFETWRNHQKSGAETVYVGYSPVIVVDAEKILSEVEGAHVLHVVRNPWSAYADTKKRPVPLPLATYLLGWTLNQYYALLARELFPDRMHIIRLEDELADPAGRLGDLCKAIGLEPAATLGTPSFNGKPLTEVYPWGTIRKATPEANRETALELDEKEREEVRLRARPYLELLDYESFL